MEEGEEEKEEEEVEVEEEVAKDKEEGQRWRKSVEINASFPPFLWRLTKLHFH